MIKNIQLIIDGKYYLVQKIINSYNIKENKENLREIIF